MRTSTEPPKVNKRGPKPGQKTWDSFTEALKLSKGRWVNVENFTSNYGYQLARMIRRGEVDVPGGVDAWDIRVVAVYPQGTEGPKHTEMWVKPV